MTGDDEGLCGYTSLWTVIKVENILGNLFPSKLLPVREEGGETMAQVKVTKEQRRAVRKARRMVEELVNY